MAMRIGLDRALCDGNGLCMVEAPDYFRLDDDDTLALLAETVGDADLPRLRRAVDICPKAALTLLDETGRGGG